MKFEYFYNMKLKSLILSFFVVFLFGCNSVRVNYDYDRKTDFSNYKSFNFYSTSDSGLSELDARRLLRITTEAMEAKGFSLEEPADFYIGFKSAEFNNLNRNSVGVSVGGTGRNVGGGVTVGVPMQGRLSREIIFEFYDESGEPKIFWEGIGTSAFNPDSTPNEREANLRAIVNKVLEKYPPQ